MYTRTTIIALLAAVAQARFGEEQGAGAVDAIAALTDLGQPGEAATLAGASIQFLLAAANPCAKLQHADKIVAALGTSDRAIAAARGYVAAEQNFNPFVVSIPNICSDPSLPATSQLRGVVPLIDPAVTGQEIENANAVASKTTPFPADGLSVAQVMVAQGFSNFTGVALDGTKTPGSSLGNGGAAAPPASSAAATSAAVTTAAPTASATATGIAGCGPVSFVTVTRAASSATSPAAVPTATSAAGTCTGSGQTMACASPADGSGAVSDPVTGTFEGFKKSTIAGLGFGICVPTIKFEAGLNGRAETAFTFQAIDPLVNKGQQEALNPNIITNRIKDQLTNVCGANQAAKDAAVAAMAQIQALGTRDQSTADAWNTALGFAGTDTNPDNAPQAGLVGHT